MTLKFIKVVRKARGMTPSAKLVLWTLADMARDDGVCWPSHQHLADETGLSPRTVRTVLAELEGIGWLWREPQRRRNGTRKADIIHLRTLDMAARPALFPRPPLNDR